MPHSDPSSIFSLPINPYTATVQCPRRGGDVPFEACRSCGFGWWVHTEPVNGCSFVVCEVVGPLSQRVAATPVLEASTTLVSAIMTRKVISVRPSLSVERLILLLIDEGIGGVPVVDELKQVIGMVSRSDLVCDDYDWADLRDDFQSYPRQAEAHVEGEDLFLPELLHSRCVGDIMSSTVVKVSASASVAEAAAVIHSSRVHEAIVIGAANELAGVVSKSDLVRWLAGATASN